MAAGIFTTTGFQAADLGHPLFIFVLWVIGGTLALLGALCYAELGAMMPRAGAEYVYLRETYGPAVGFMSAWVSLVAGFSAPHCGRTQGLRQLPRPLLPFLADDPTVGGVVAVIDLIAVGLVWLLVAIHVRAVRSGTGFNDFHDRVQGGRHRIDHSRRASIGRGTWPTGHCVTVLSGAEPHRYARGVWHFLDLRDVLLRRLERGGLCRERDGTSSAGPTQALLLGTAIVSSSLSRLNAVYFYGASVDELAGQVEVGLVASRSLFGPTGVSRVTIVLCASILASASAMTLVGPRVYYALGKDFKPFAFLARTRQTALPPWRSSFRGS